MTNLAGLPPLGIKDRDAPKPKRQRKAIPRESKARKAKKASDEGKAGREHMARVAALPCVCCGYWPVEVHHCKSGRYSQRKAADTDTIPLCRNHHQGPEGFHTDQTAWEAKYGPDTDYLPVVADQLAGQFNDPWGKR